METEDMIREQKLQQMAERYDLQIYRSKARNPQAPTFGKFHICPAGHSHQKHDYIFSVEEAEMACAAWIRRFAYTGWDPAQVPTPSQSEDMRLIELINKKNTTTRPASPHFGESTR